MTVDGNTHPFDAAIRLAGKSDACRGQTSKHYANMVGPFGGIIAATLLTAAFDHDERQGGPVALTVNFVAPVADGGFDVVTRIVRTNRSTQHWIVELSQEGLITATATAVFAIRRPTWSATELQMPSAPGPDECARVAGDHFPPWVNRYDIRMVKGGAPPLFSIAGEEAFSDSVSLLWIRDEPRRPLDFLSLASICDSFFPRLFIRREGIVPAGTVSLTVYFHADAATLSEVGDQYVLGHARANRFHNNYFDQTAEVWSPDGELLATSSQVVYYKE